MARVKDLWFSEVPAKDANGKTVRDPDGRVVTERRKTAKHPDRGGNKNAKRWLARWIDPDGKEATKAFARQSEGKTYADRMEADGQRGEYIDPDAGREKFGDLARKVMRLRDVGPSSRERYESVYRNHVETVSGKRPVKGVRASDIVEWLRGPISKMSGSIQEAAYNIVAFTFDVVVEDKLRRDNPARSKIVPVPRAEYSPREPWTPERYWQVRDEHPAAYRALTDCEAGMGLRRGEASGLAENDFTDDGKARIRRQVAWVGGQWVFFVWRGGQRLTGKSIMRESTYGKPIRAGTYEQGCGSPPYRGPG